MHERQQPDGADALGQLFDRVVQLVGGIQLVGRVFEFGCIVFVICRVVVEFGCVQLVVRRLEFQLEQREQQRRRRFVQL